VECPAGDHSAWSKPFSHYLAKGLVPTPSLCTSQFLMGMADPAALSTVVYIVSAYFETCPVADHLPEMSYMANVFATDPASGSTFTAFWRLMQARRPANLVIGNGVKEFTAV
jgi:hypothetical protein